MPLKQLVEARERLTAKQNELASIFDESKNDEGQLDFTRVKSIEGGANAVADEVKRRNAELEDIAREVEALAEGEKAEQDQHRRDRLLNQPAAMPHFPNGDDGKTGRRAIPDFAELVTKSERFQEWHKRGSAGGVSLQLDDAFMSDWMAKAGMPNTLGMKTLFQTSAGWDPFSPRLPGFVEGVTRPIQLLDIIPLGQTQTDTITYMEETTRTHAAAEKAEGGTFAESTFALTEKTSLVRKITDSIPVTDEQLEDVSQVESYLNGRLVFGIRQRLDTQVLVGDGVAPNLDGIKNVTGINTQAKGSDPTPDAFFKAMRKIRVTGRAQPTHIIIHPEDWEEIRLLRTADGIYVWGNPSESGAERMWGLPVIQSDADSAGTGYVGSFQPAWVSLFERRGVDVQVGFTGSQFVEGKRTIRADGRWAFVVFRPAAFSTVTGI